jgi:hypothetical protein
MICGAQTAAALPPLLKVLANTKKKDAAMVIQQALDARARMLDSTRVSPVVTPEIVECAYQFTPGARDPDDLMTGFNPFLFHNGSAKSATLARARTITYSHLHGGNVAPTLDQIRELVTSAPNMAQSLTALERCYQGCSTFLDVMLGQDQRMALEFRAFVDAFQGLKQELEDEFGAALPTVLPLFQRHTQLALIRHFNDASIRGALAPLPKLMDLVDLIHFKQWTHLIPLPARYFVVPRRTDPPPAPLLPPAFVPALPPAIAPAPPPAPARAPAAARSEPRINTAPDTGLLARFARTNKRLGDLAPRGTVLPRADNGTDELCLSYSLRGECHSTCKRRDVSHRQLTPTEVSRLNGFLTQAGVE